MQKFNTERVCKIYIEMKTISLNVKKIPDFWKTKVRDGYLYHLNFKSKAGERNAERTY